MRKGRRNAASHLPKRALGWSARLGASSSQTSCSTIQHNHGSGEGMTVHTHSVQRHHLTESSVCGGNNSARTRLMNQRRAP